ncbi:carbon-nitrogen family hydrolase [Listeria goaensis]|uniref:carbon-nitrogen family hydrolase n=1 Tax=Listeria goaensis TaxID=1649188 RepID=UPI000B58C418|nr:carbon-nitrogen family hydrolase [Listeria goaensis]
MWKLALCQIDVTFKDPDANFKRVRQTVTEAARSGAEIAVLPEMWNTGYCLSELEIYADRHGERTKKFLSELAREQNITIIGGSVAIKTDGKFTNIMYAFDNQGDFLSSYKKVHPFKLMDEHLYLEPGNDANLFMLNGTKTAGFICYDIRFPEWIRHHTARGAEVIFVVAQWPDVRISQWEKLLVARAIENQAFVVAVNRVGKDPNNQFNGHSMVINPHGEILLLAGETEENFYSTIDLAEISAARQSMSIFEDRRPELYF